MARETNLDVKRYGTSSGGFRQSALIEQPVDTQDSVGQPTLSWTTVIDAWRCSIEPLSGREYMAGGIDVGETVLRFVGRYVPGIAPTMRATVEGVIYDIVDVDDVQFMHRVTVLTCKQGVKVNG